MNLSNNKNVSHGNNSTNIGQAKNVEITYESKNEIKINDYKKKKVGEVNLKPKKISLLSAFTFGATLLAYIRIFIKFPITELPDIGFFIPLLTIVSLLILVLSKVLHQRKFILLFDNFCIETDDNKIFLKKYLYIKCPICSSKMRLLQTGNNTLVSCKRNPELHTFYFDYTTFDDTENNSDLN